MTTKTTKKSTETTLVSNLLDLQVDNDSIEKAAEALEKAKAEEKSTKLALGEATKSLSRMKSAIANGDDVTSEDLQAEHVKVEHAQLRHDGASKRLKRIESQNLVTSTELIEAAAPFIDRILPGVTTLYGIGPAPSKCPVPKSQLPVMVLTQEKGHSVSRNYDNVPSRSGAIAGKLTLRYWRDSEVHKPLSGDAIVRSLCVQPNEAYARKVFDRGDYDEVNIDILTIYPRIPRVAGPSPTVGVAVNAGYGWLNRAVESSTRNRRSGEPLYGTRNTNNAFGVNGVYVPLDSVQATVTAVNTTSDGIRSTVITVKGVVVSVNGSLGAVTQGLESRTPEILEDMVTEYGRIVNASLETGHLDGAGGFPVTLTLTIHSR